VGWPLFEIIDIVMGAGKTGVCVWVKIKFDFQYLLPNSVSCDEFIFLISLLQFFNHSSNFSSTNVHVVMLFLLVLFFPFTYFI